MRNKGSRNWKTLQRIARGKAIAKESGIYPVNDTSHYIRLAKEEESVGQNQPSAKLRIIPKRGRSPLPEGERQVVRTAAAPPKLWDAVEQYKRAQSLKHFSDALRELITMGLE